MPDARAPAGVAREELRALIDRGIAAGLWSSVHGCANRCQVPRTSIRRIIGGPRLPSTTDAILETIRRVVEDEEGTGPRGSKTGLPTEVRADGATPSRSTYLYDLIAAGIVDEPIRSMHGCRYVLRAEHFRTLTGDIRREELRDTREMLRIAVAVLTELRRRFALAAQNDDLRVRQTAAEALRTEIDELFIAIESSRAFFPAKAGEYIRQRWNSFDAESGSPLSPHSRKKEG